MSRNPVTMEAYLPHSDGWLPYYVLLVGVTAITNALSCYGTDSYVRRLYSIQYAETSNTSKITKTETTVIEETSSGADRRPSVSSVVTSGPAAEAGTSSLNARTFATWNIAVGVVRLFAAFHLHEPAWYHLQLIANLIGLGHFMAEAFYFKTARPWGPWLAPVGVASIGIVWSISQYDFYIR